jgi:hypothetical protein
MPVPSEHGTCCSPTSKNVSIGGKNALTAITCRGLTEQWLDTWTWRMSIEAVCWRPLRHHLLPELSEAFSKSHQCASNWNAQLAHCKNVLIGLSGLWFNKFRHYFCFYIVYLYRQCPIMDFATLKVGNLTKQLPMSGCRTLHVDWKNSLAIALCH